MSNALIAFENQLKPLAPRFADVLGATMPVERLIRTVVISVERMPKLLECDRQSLFNAAMSAAVLGLEVDGVTGQAFLIPFKNKAQLVIGYKGFNTIAARAGITISGGVVRDGDLFEYELGSSAFVRHIPALGSKGRIVAAWATATALNRTPVVHVMGIDDLLAVKARSPGARRDDSPWNDPTIGFPAMCEKTAKRRLARSLPMNAMHAAARMDEAVDEQGKSAWIAPDLDVIVEGELIQPNETPSAADLIGSPRGQNARTAPPVEQPASLASSPDAQGEAGDEVLVKARAAAMRGWSSLTAFYKTLSPADKAKVKTIDTELQGLCPD